MTAATVCTPLRSEWAALHGVVSAPVHRTGRGPAGRLPSSGPVLVAGVAGALTADLRPGDLVVAESLRESGTEFSCPAGPLLFAAVRRLGLRVRLGPVLSRERVLHDRRRAEATDALAVDTESAYLAGQTTTGQTVALRAIVDTPAAPLLRPGTVWRGLTALRALRAAAPAIDQWVAATGDREVLLASPRSFCAGVERAVGIVEAALQRFGAPVYVRHQIVHNRAVVRELESRGAVFVDELDAIPQGARVVFSAHGVAPSVRREAEARGLRVVDATCPLVAKVHTEVRRFAAQGKTVYLIGHPEHEEVVGTRGEASGSVTVVTDPAAAAEVQPADPGNVAYVMQTTLAADEAERTAAVLRRRFPAIVTPGSEDICYATTNRQTAVRAIAQRCDLVLVVGSDNSSNSRRLVEVAERCGAPAYLVDDATAVDLRWLAGARRVGVTAGASAPPHLVDQLIGSLSGLGQLTVTEAKVANEDIRFTLPREVS
jgi:4-hydroxy-3-methylbut-2-enyl diphosphate reductase